MINSRITLTLHGPALRMVISSPKKQRKSLTHSNGRYNPRVLTHLRSVALLIRREDICSCQTLLTSEKQFNDRI